MDEYKAHLDRCDECNYGKECMLCEGGFDHHDLGITPEQLAESHSCNCGKGKGGRGFPHLLGSDPQGCVVCREYVDAMGGA